MIMSQEIAFRAVAPVHSKAVDDLESQNVNQIHVSPQKLLHLHLIYHLISLTLFLHFSDQYFIDIVYSVLNRAKVRKKYGFQEETR